MDAILADDPNLDVLMHLIVPSGYPAGFHLTA
jgi:hypothetical protein